MPESVHDSSEFDVHPCRPNPSGSFGALKSTALTFAVVGGVVLAIWVNQDSPVISGQQAGASRVLEARGGPIFALKWSPDGSKLAASRGGRSVSILDVREGSRRTIPMGPGGARVALGWSPDGRSLMVWGLDDSAGFRPVDGSESPTVPVDLRTMAASIGGCAVRLWGPEDLRAGRLPGRASRPHAMAFSPDGRMVAWGGSDGVVRASEVATGREAWRASTINPRPGVRGIGVVAFSPDGSTVASAGVGPVRVWDASTGLDRGHLGSESSGSTFLAFSPDGLRLAEASWDGSIRVWEPARGVEVARFPGQSCRVAALAWSPDGRTLAVGTFEGVVNLWDPSPSP